MYIPPRPLDPPRYHTWHTYYRLQGELTERGEAHLRLETSCRLQLELSICLDYLESYADFLSDIYDEDAMDAALRTNLRIMWPYTQQRWAIDRAATPLASPPATVEVIH